MAEPLRRPAPETPLYERDFFAWTEAQAAALRERRYADLDIDNLIDEVETLGRSQRNEIKSRLLVLLVHLLKWRHQAEKRSGSWKGSVVEQRKRLRALLDENPSLRDVPAQALDDEYETARLKAAGETGLAEDAFPETCPFRIEDILDPAFWPGPEGA